MTKFKISGVAAFFAVAAVACAAAPAPAALVQPAAKAATVIVDCQGAGQTRPRSYVIACGDGNNYLSGLRWTAWRAGSATARGTDVANDCVPYCAAGHFHRYPVKVALNGSRPWAGHPGVDRFSLITLHYTGARPAGLPRTLTFTLP